MILFLLYTAVGAFSLAMVNSFFRANPWNLTVLPLLVLMVVPTTFGTQWGFLNALQVAPSFLTAWFVGSGFSAIAGLLASVFIFGESLRVLHFGGICLILGGSFLLTR